MSTPDFDRQIREHLPQGTPSVPPIDPRSLDRPYEATSADGNVTATVAGQTLEVTSVHISRYPDGDPAAVGRSVVEAVNAALAAAESGPLGFDLEQAMAQRVAELEQVMDRMSGRLDSLDSELDGILDGLSSQSPPRRPDPGPDPTS